MTGRLVGIFVAMPGQSPQPPTPPLVSVIIPCFNAAVTIGSTLDSVFEQTLADFEVIAVDDCSRDATYSLLEARARVEPRLRVRRQVKNAGPSAARNAGLELARGQFVALIDADDLWDPTYLAQMVARFASDAQLGVSFSRVRYLNADGSATGETTRPKLTELTAADILCDNPCGCGMWVARRAVYDDVGRFNEALMRAEDQEWLFRVALKGWTISGVPLALAGYRNSPGGLSANLDAQFATYLEWLAHMSTLAPEVVARARGRAIGSMLLYCARRALRLGQERAVARGFLARALKAAPDLVLRRPRAVFGMMAALAVSRAA